MPDYEAEIAELESRLANLQQARERDAEIVAQREQRDALESAQEQFRQRERSEFVQRYAQDYNASGFDRYGSRVGADPRSTERYCIERMKESMASRMAASAEQQYGVGSPLATYFRRWSTGL